MGISFDALQASSVPLAWSLNYRGQYFLCTAKCKEKKKRLDGTDWSVYIYPFSILIGAQTKKMSFFSNPIFFLFFFSSFFLFSFFLLFHFIESTYLCISKVGLKVEIVKYPGWIVCTGSLVGKVVEVP